ncbi:hypothetical protein [Methylobacterium nodulans]|uniref:Uncharacterized protein n=1 Tax=Methylobacterium nodulans (strain LMG 21967 / CNCM I-2342 / ORS 2060) TaxID=460265 RepID=B8ILL2_METNO|nr:hypothetical protein [Methylobacterium nodulans]ACL61987.1 conserved hypothetical protein [Methylobacterium nodulans ORS 2060]
MDTKADLIRYDIRRDRFGWTVYDVRTGQTAVIDGVLQVGLDMDEADAIADALSADAPLPGVPGAVAAARWQLAAAPDAARFRRA